jgi:lipoprotein-releasing system permease protein
MRYLRARRKEGFISVIAGFSFAGIMLGVATLIIVMSVMNGFRIELMGKILGLNGHMMVRGIGENLANYDAFVDEVSLIDGVVRVAPMVEGQAMASSQFNGSGVLVRGMREKDLNAIPEVSGNLQAGTLQGFDTSGGIAIGTRLAQSLYLKLGDKVTLLSPRGSVTPFGTAPRVRSYPITAIFEVGMTEYDSSFVFLPLSVAQKFFKTGDRVTALEIMIEDPDQVDHPRGRCNRADDAPLYMAKAQCELF